MKRDIIGDIFLGGVLLSLLFLFSFPAYFCYTRNVPRDIFLFERIMSVCFLLGLVMSVIWACWKKKVWVMLGICSFGLLAYLPKWFLPKIELRLSKPGKNIIDTLLSTFFNRIYELVHAPFTGLIGMCSEKQAEKLPYLILPVVIIAYLISQIVRFYHNAYVAEKKQIHDFDHFRKTNAVRSPVMPFAPEPEAPSPLGTIVLNEKAEVAAETFPVKKQEDDQTVMNNLSGEAAAALPSGEQPTEVIALAAHAPSSAPSDETQVIALAAHSPSTPIELPARAPSSADLSQTAVQEPVRNENYQSEIVPFPKPEMLPAGEEEGTVEMVVPTEMAEPVDTVSPVEMELPTDESLDFPDVHGEAEKIDVFGDSDLD